MNFYVYFHLNGCLSALPKLPDGKCQSLLLVFSFIKKKVKIWKIKSQEFCLFTFHCFNISLHKCITFPFYLSTWFGTDFILSMLSSISCQWEMEALSALLRWGVNGGSLGVVFFFMIFFFVFLNYYFPKTF